MQNVTIKIGRYLRLTIQDGDPPSILLSNLQDEDIVVVWPHEIQPLREALADAAGIIAELAVTPGIEIALNLSLQMLAEGRSIEECLERFPAYAEKLKPLLETRLELQQIPLPEQRPEAVEDGKRKMEEALLKRTAARYEAARVADIECTCGGGRVTGSHHKAGCPMRIWTE